jgi:type III secretory pathway component EscS
MTIRSNVQNCNIIIIININILQNHTKISNQNNLLLSKLLIISSCRFIQALVDGKIIVSHVLKRLNIRIFGNIRNKDFFLFTFYLAETILQKMHP